MSEKTFRVTLLRGYSFTDAKGRTFYQNRAKFVTLDEMEAQRLRSLEDGTKFSIVEEAKLATVKAAPAASPPADASPVVESKPDDGEPDPFDDEPPEDPDFEAMTKAEIKAYLDRHDVKFDDKATKADLIEIAEKL